MSRKHLAHFDSMQFGRVIANAFRKLDPRIQWRSEALAVVYVGGIVATLLVTRSFLDEGEGGAGFIFATTVGLWIAALIANAADAIATRYRKDQPVSQHARRKTDTAEDAYRKKGRNEVALALLLAVFAIAFLFVAVIFLPFTPNAVQLFTR